MDTITQIALGAAVGEAVLGRKVGNKALLWGAVGGTIPDLDVLARPLLNGVENLGFHRGFSHSILFAIMLAPILGWLVQRLHRNSPLNASWRQWSWLFFWSVFTHPILDSFTSYGTQLFQPFSDYPVALSSIFIIDPVYTVPLLAGVIAVLFMQRTTARRRTVIYAALGFSTVYLLLTLGIKLQVESAFRSSLAQQDVTYSRLFSNPMPLNSLLWMGVAEQDESLYIGLYSIFDDGETIEFQRVEKNSELIADKLDQAAIRKLLWFSRGYYTVTEKDGTLYFNDLRFGRSDLWLSEHGEYVFSFRLIKDPENPEIVEDIFQERPAFALDGTLLQRFWARILSNHEGV